MNTWLRFLFAGVGGQGVLSAGRWVGDAAASCDVPVVVGQVHGLSQRGGSVQSSVALGGARTWEIHAGMADALVAIEPMEGARAIGLVSNRTTALVNTRPLLPGSFQSLGRPYPPMSSLLESIREAAGSVVAVDATALAREAGSTRSLNVVMLGMLAGSNLLPFPAERLLDVILTAGIRDFQEINRSAFRLGVEAIGKKVSTI